MDCSHLRTRTQIWTTLEIRGDNIQLIVFSHNARLTDTQTDEKWN